MTDAAPLAGNCRSLSIGDRLGPYEIIGPLGSGGMGEVYRARDSRLDREVAVKVISNRMMHDGQSLRRFENEAKVIASLSHPNIVAIHDFNTHGEISFVVMELLHGESLQERLAREKLSPAQAVQIAIAVAEGLASAHARGVIHRDLKPANIFLTDDGQIKILDFGLAKRLSGDSTRSSIATETRPGFVVGTIGYMSPEQVSGSEVDARSDIFALGCVLYEMISGKRAFVRASPAETFAAILRDNPADGSQLVQKGPPSLARVIERCLLKNPDLRFQSARDVAFALREAAESRAMRIPTVVWATAALAALIAAVAMIILFRPRQANPYRPLTSVAVLPFVNTTHNPQTEILADGMTETITNKLAELPQLKVMSQSTMFRYKGNTPDPRQVGRDLNVSSVLTGRIVQTGDRLDIDTELVDASDGRQVWGERYRRPLSDIFALQDDIAHEISEKLRLKLTGEQQKRLTKRYTDNPEAYALYVEGRFYWNKRSPAALQKALDLFNQAAQRDPNYPLPYLGIADCYAILPQYSGTPHVDAWPKAKAAVLRALERDPELAEAHATLGLIHQQAYEWREAEPEYQRAIALKPNYATAYQWYGLTLRREGRFSESLEQVKKAQALDPLSLIINSNLGIDLDETGRDAEAVRQFQRTIDLDPTFFHAHMHLGLVYLKLRDYENGVRELEKAAELTKRSTEALSRLGFGYGRAGRRADALRILNELKQRANEKHASAFRVGYVYAGLSDRGEAYRWFERALREQDGALSEINESRDIFDDSWRSDARFQQLLRGMNLLQ